MPHTPAVAARGSASEASMAIEAQTQRYILKTAGRGSEGPPLGPAISMLKGKRPNGGAKAMVANGLGADVEGRGWCYYGRFGNTVYSNAPKPAEDQRAEAAEDDRADSRGFDTKPFGSRRNRRGNKGAVGHGV